MTSNGWKRPEEERTKASHCGNAPDYDRGEKFEQYRKIPTFVEYLLIAQDHCHVEHFVKQPTGDWLLSETNRMTNVLSLPSISCTLNLTDVYEKVLTESV